MEEEKGEEEKEEKVCRQRSALREEREPRELEMGKLGHVEKSSCNDPRACVSAGLCFIFILGSSLIIGDVPPVLCRPERQQKTSFNLYIFNLDRTVHPAVKGPLNISTQNVGFYFLMEFN